MKRIFLLLALLLCVSSNAQEIKGFVNDYANVLSPEQEAELEGILNSLYEAKLAEYAVVTINSLEGRDIEGYAYELAEGNLGEEGKNNGLLLLVAVDDRKYRFEVGRGLEPVLPDITAGRIGRQYLVPNFRNEDYGLGVIEASKAVKAIIAEDTNSTYYNTDRSLGEELERVQTLFHIGFIIVIILLIAFATWQTGRRKKRGDDSDYFLAAWALGNILSNKGKGGFSGGFGGFGGGSFGGGGASGGW